MISKTHLRLLLAGAVVLGASSFSATAQSSASGSLDLNSLTVTAASGGISWPGWNLGAVSTTLNGNGEFDQNSDFESGPATAAASASVTYANAGSSATASTSDPSGISGHAGGIVLIPAAINAAASVSGGFGNYGSLETQFTLSQDSSVSFSAMIAAMQAMETDGAGQVLENEVIFNLNVDGNPILFYDSPLTLGPNAFLDTGATSKTLSMSVDLTAGMHDLFIEVDAEQQVVERGVPDLGDTGLLLFGALSLLGVVRRPLGTLPSSERSV